jgi:hypothetical protein
LQQHDCLPKKKPISLAGPENIGPTRPFMRIRLAKINTMTKAQTGKIQYFLANNPGIIERDFFFTD